MLRPAALSPELQQLSMQCIDIMKRLDRLIVQKRITDEQAKRFSKEMCDFLLSLAIPPSASVPATALPDRSLFNNAEATLSRPALQSTTSITSLRGSPIHNTQLQDNSLYKTPTMEPHLEDDDELDETVNFVPDSSFEDVFDDKDADQNNFETKSLGLPQQWKKKKRRTFSLQEFGRAIARKASSVRKSTRRLIADIRHKTPKSEQLNRRNSHNQYVLASVALTAAHNKTLLDLFN
ncbi:hypothetical protein WR25_20891 isoform A [Diploscapter pachys]|uniref:Uncharacterized protein n=1 Tax=Diploscapter pachys TaxID=2018661 RepID=A0A2A2KSU4_9BILA|nr:hypothetical protein WR25_20891 isoform A [Diploscapter pachys]